MGSFELRRQGRAVAVSEWQGAKPRRLLQALVTHRSRSVGQEELLDWLWPGMSLEAARNCLYVAVNRIRRVLEPDLPRGGESRFIVQWEGSYQFRSEGAWIDVEAFESAYRRGLEAAREGDAEAASRRFQEASDLCRGPYLQEERYAEWALVERERLRELYLELKLASAEALARLGRHRRAIGEAEEVISQDRVREEAYRRVMQSYLELGERAEALRAFERCRRLLVEELGVDPTPQTRTLYEEILSAGQGEEPPLGQAFHLRQAGDWGRLGELVGALHRAGKGPSVLFVLVEPEQREHLFRLLRAMAPVSGGAAASPEGGSRAGN